MSESRLGSFGFDRQTPGKADGTDRVWNECRSKGLPLPTVAIYFALTSEQSRFDEAAYAATTTIAFIAPSETIPEAIKQIGSDLNASVVGAFTDLDIGVWMTPADTTYVDGEPK